MSPFFASLSLTAALAACAMDQARGPAPATGLTCAVDLTTTGGLISLTARATATQSTSAHWGLSVTSADGAVLIDQGGTTSLPAGQPVVLSEIAFTGSGARLTADLTLTVDGRRQTCPVTTP